MKNIIKIKKSVCSIVALTSLILSGASQAAEFKLETSVKGYPGYVLVNPSLRYVLGGRVRWNSSLHCYETDRVSRGERLRISILPSTRGEICKSGAIAGITSSNGSAYFQSVNLPYVETRFGVSTNPSFDNVHLIALTSSGRYEIRLPIGRR